MEIFRCIFKKEEDHKSKIQSQAKLWTKQLLDAIAFCHENSIIHCDVKPSNIFLDSNNDLVLGDFGSAKKCSLGSEHRIRNVEKGSIATVCYSAPEVLACLPTFNHAVDIWSCACVCLQLLNATSYPVFRKPNDFVQLDHYFFHFGTPLVEELEPNNYNNYTYLGQSRNQYWSEFKQSSRYGYIEHYDVPKTPLHWIEDNQARDLLLQMFQLNPSKRITAKEALSHIYFKDIE